MLKLNKDRKAATNRRLAKKRVQWLNEALCFVPSFVVADSLVLSNPARTQYPKRCTQPKTKQRDNLHLL